MDFKEANSQRLKYISLINNGYQKHKSDIEKHVLSFIALVPEKFNQYEMSLYNWTHNITEYHENLKVVSCKLVFVVDYRMDFENGDTAEGIYDEPTFLNTFILNKEGLYETL